MLHSVTKYWLRNDYAILRMLRNIPHVTKFMQIYARYAYITHILRIDYAVFMQWLRKHNADITHCLRIYNAMFTQWLRRVYAVITHCYAGITQALHSHYADITQTLGHLPLSDNYAVLHSHYAELRIGYAVIRSVTQCYAGFHFITHTATCWWF